MTQWKPFSYIVCGWIAIASVSLERAMPFALYVQLSDYTFVGQWYCFDENQSFREKIPEVSFYSNDATGDGMMMQPLPAAPNGCIQRS